MKNHSFEFLSDTIFPDILLKCRWYDGVFYTLIRSGNKKKHQATFPSRFIHLFNVLGRVKKFSCPLQFRGGLCKKISKIQQTSLKFGRKLIGVSESTIKKIKNLVMGRFSPKCGPL
jgi:hypothetical protein